MSFAVDLWVKYILYKKDLLCYTYRTPQIYLNNNLIYIDLV